MIARSGLLLDGGHYKLVSRIAVGGMGEVWRSHDLTTRTPVAIKVLRPEHTGDATSLRRLRFEARNAAMLNHPNITKVLDYGEVEGTGYIVMEYVEGQSLADVLATHSTLAPLRLLPILIQAALGLHAAHSAGVVHRDVKPGNILLGHADHVKLTDFGISVAHGQLPLTDTGKVMGTAQYLSPEQALGNPATAAGDLYSLGVIAYEALAGERPFRGANYVAIALAQVNEPPPPLPASVEKSLADLVMRLMEKDPAKRPGSGAELAGLFGGILDIHRDLVGRLLATRRGSAAPGPARPDSGPPRVTAEQERVPAASIMPAAAPQTAEAPAVPEAAPAEPAGPDGQPPVYPPAPASPPPKRRLPPPHTPEVAQPLPTAPPVPPRQELSYPLPGEPPRPAPRAEAAQPAAAGAQRNPSATPVPPLDQPRPRDEFPSAGAAGPGQPSSTPASGQPGGGPPAPGMPGAGATGPGQPGGAPASGQPGGGPPAPGMPGGGATGPGPQGGAPGPGPGPSAGGGLGAGAPAPGPPGGGATGPGQPGGAPASGRPGGGPPAPGMPGGRATGPGQQGGVPGPGPGPSAGPGPGAGAPASGMPGGGATGPGQPGSAPASGQPGGGPPAPGMPGAGATGPGAPPGATASPPTSLPASPPAGLPAGLPASPPAGLPAGGAAGYAAGEAAASASYQAGAAGGGLAAAGPNQGQLDGWEAGRAPAGQPPPRFSREWWAPLLVAVGLVLLLLIGLVTALSAEGGSVGGGPLLFHSQAAPTIMIANDAPGAAQMRER